MSILLFFCATGLFLQYVSTVPTAPADNDINSCTGGEFETSSRASILCKFYVDVNSSRLAFLVSHTPNLQTNALTGRGVLQCNWHTNGTLHCTNIDGYSYQNGNVNDQLTLDIPDFGPAFAGFYTCYVFDDGHSSPEPCAVVVKKTSGFTIVVPCLVVIIAVLVLLFIAGYMKGYIIICYNTSRHSQAVATAKETSQLLPARPNFKPPNTIHEEEKYSAAVTKSVQTNTEEDFKRTTFKSYFNVSRPLGPEMRSYPINFNVRQRVKKMDAVQAKCVGIQYNADDFAAVPVLKSQKRKDRNWQKTE